MVNLFGNHEVQYTFVNGGSRLRPTYSLRTIITTASILLATVISSFYAGRSSISQATKGPLDRTPLPLFSCTSIPRSCASYFFACGSPPDLLAKVPTHSQIFYQNHTFGAAPSNVSNAAWASLFPDQGGFFKHPNIAPQRSAWAVFHQLHCLVSRETKPSFFIQSPNTRHRTVSGKGTGPYMTLPFTATNSMSKISL